MLQQKKPILFSAVLAACFIFSQSVYASSENDLKTHAAHSNIKNFIMSNNKFFNVDRSETRKETLSKARMTKLNAPNQQIASQITYKVEAGDNLTKISKKFNVPVEDIVAWNQLESPDKIYAGQILYIYLSSSEGAIEKPDENNAGNEPGETASEDTAEEQAIHAKLAKEKAIEASPSEKGQAIYNRALEIAQAQLGVPYVFGGNTPEGFDCSGFVRYVYFNAGLDLQRKSSEDYFMQDTTVVKNPVPGDLIFFKNTYKTGISHMGIYLGEGKFIHAGNDGVEISNMEYDYWKKRFVAYKRFNGIQ